jgi:GNAT superfamily N-acetyltransferase
MKKMNFNSNIICKPATADNWDDLENLFGETGAYWGCWCMYWRCTNKEFEQMKSADRRIAFKKEIEQKEFSPGILAYIDSHVVGWIAISPKKEYKRLIKSRVIKSIDQKPVWSIVCFFIHKEFRRQGISKNLLIGAENYAKSKGAEILESYPIESEEKINEVYAYVGTEKVFKEVGFSKVAETNAKSGGKKKIIMRKEI